MQPVVLPAVVELLELLELELSEVEALEAGGRSVLGSQLERKARARAVAMVASFIVSPTSHS